MKDKSDAGVTCGADSQAALHKDIIAPAMTLGTSSIFLSLQSIRTSGEFSAV